MSREYQAAGKILDEVATGKNLKAVCGKTRVGKIDYLLATETLKYKSTLDEILDGASVSSNSLDIGSQGMLLVLVYELLVGSGKIRGGGKVKRVVMGELAKIEESLQKLLEKKKAVSIADLLPESTRLADNLPSFLRINSLKIRNKRHFATVIDAIRQKCPEARMDEHIDNLVVLPPGSASFGQHELVADGTIIIQDKASCFPSQVLADAWMDGNVIDACAAPGNKTSHIAAILTTRMHDGATKGSCEHIYAFDKSSERKNLLQSRMANAGAESIVQVTETDFLTIDTASNIYSRVTTVLLDPSCSGSGVARDLGRLGNNDKSSPRGRARLDKLRGFQVQAIHKAMELPSITLLSYSTCSVWEEENESVVAEVLTTARQRGWRLLAPPRMQSWKRRGHAFEGLSQEESAALLRCEPVDGVNGFFVALFEKRERVGSAEEEEEEEEIVEVTAVEEDNEDDRSVERMIQEAALHESDIGGGEESEEDRADRQEYAEEVRRGVFGPNSGPGPRLKKRRMWSPAHKTPRW